MENQTTTQTPVATPVPESVTQPTPPSPKKLPVIVWVLIILLILCLGGLAFLGFQNFQLQGELAQMKQVANTPQTTPNPIPTSTPIAQDSFQFIRELTSPMVWSSPKSDTHNLSNGEVSTGQSITTSIPEKSQDKVAPLLATNSSLNTYGWTADNNESAGGIGGQIIAFTKTTENITKLLIITADNGTGEYTVFISN